MLIPIDVIPVHVQSTYYWMIVHIMNSVCRFSTCLLLYDVSGSFYGSLAVLISIIYILFAGLLVRVSFF